MFRALYPASKKLLLERVSEIDIFLIWCTDFKRLDSNFRSPICIDDVSQGERSAVIGYSGDHYVLRDFRLGRSFGALGFAELMSGISKQNLIQYLCEYFDLPIEDKRFNITAKPKLTVLSKIVAIKTPSEIDVDYAAWDWDKLNWWNRSAWNSYMLDKASIYPISKFWITNKHGEKVKYTTESLGNLSFTYDLGELDGVFRRKIYNPHTIKNKWFGNSGNSIIQGLNTIETHVSDLYITSSLKDCGPFWRILGHPCAIAPNSESSLLSVEQVRMLRQISDNQILWYDNDVVGRINAQKHSNLYGFEMRYNPIGSPKDPSDYWKKRDGREFNKLII